jgi:hypothetical protein
MTDIEIKEGEDSGIAWLVNNATTGAPYDLTGWTVKAQVRSTPNSVLLHEWSTALNNVIVDAQGNLILVWSAADTHAMDFDEAAYNIKLVSPGGSSSILDNGQVRLVRGTTK